MLNSALVIKMLQNSSSERKKNFGPLIKRGTISSKERDMSSEKYILLDFTKYLSCKSVTKTLYQNKFLVNECIFKLVGHCESCRLSEISYA